MRRVMEIFSSISFWASSLSVHSRAAFWMRPLGFVSVVLPALLWWPTVGTKPSSDQWAQACFDFRLGCVTSWEELCLLKTTRAQASR